MSFRWNLALGIVTCSLGISMFLLFLSVSSTGGKSILLLFAVAIILSGIFRLLNFFLISLPEGHCKRLASSVGFFREGYSIFSMANQLFGLLFHGSYFL